MASVASGNVLVRKIKSNKKRGAYRKCCVVGCTNTERNNPELHFYRFPARPYEAERKMIWLLAARRGTQTNKDDTWMPTESSRICSAHFEGGEKSNDPRKTSYHPTILPKIHGKQKADSAKSKRLKARNQEEPEQSISDFLEICTGDNNNTTNDQANDE